MKILIVEDEPAIRRMLAWCLEDRGHRVLEANDLEGADKLLGHADAVICDANFPTFIAIGLTEAKADNWIPILLRARKLHIPFVLVSADIHLERVAKLVNVPFFAKPFEIDRVLEVLTRVEISEPRFSEVDP